jgi:4-hydroxybenzoyl-CoA thioesterase
MIERALGMDKLAYLKAYDFAGHPVIETRARFRQPTRFGDEVAIETKLVELGRSSFKTEHRLSKAGALAVEGFETRVWIRRNAANGRQIEPLDIPAEVLARLTREVR